MLLNKESLTNKSSSESACVLSKTAEINMPSHKMPQTQSKTSRVSSQICETGSARGKSSVPNHKFLLIMLLFLDNA